MSADAEPALEASEAETAPPSLPGQEAPSGEGGQDAGAAVPLMDLRQISRNFGSSDRSQTVLAGVDITVQAGEFLAIVGPSGSGKSTLMNIMGCLDDDFDGEYFLSGRSVRYMLPSLLEKLRRQTFGFVFQRYMLIAHLSALDNVLVPLRYAGVGKQEALARAHDLLDQLGLAARKHARPAELSGGEQQRVAIARAMANKASIVLADEPTGALDSHNGEQIIELLGQLNAQGTTIIVITHSQQVALAASRQIHLHDGRLVLDTCAGRDRAVRAETLAST